MKHRQPDPDDGHPDFVREPLWTQFLPLTASSQYLLFWFVAETVPQEIEETYKVPVAHDGGATPAPIYRPPPMFPDGMALESRIDMDRAVDGSGKTTTYEPVRILGTAQDDEERLYESHLISISDARRKLKGSVMEDVVRLGWEAIHLRLQMEEKHGR